MSTYNVSLREAVIPRSSALTKSLLVLVGALFLAALAQISIPVPGSPVPVTGQTLGVLLLATAYGANMGFATFALYLVMGIAGAPVYAGQSHGFEKISGATGGYLVGMLLASWVLGALAGRHTGAPDQCGCLLEARARRIPAQRHLHVSPPL